MNKTILNIKGMHCDSCKEVIEDVCKELPEVQKCDVRFAEGIATIEHDTPLNMKQLVDEINGLGVYKVLDVLHEDRDDTPKAL